MLQSSVRTRATPQPSGVGWKEGGVNDLTEDSVELTPATEQTICSFHQQLWSKKRKRNKKKRQGEDGKRWVIRRVGGGLWWNTARMQNAAIIAHLIAVLKRWVKTWVSHFVLFWRTTVALLPELIMFRPKRQQLNSDWQSNTHTCLALTVAAKLLLKGSCARVFYRSGEEHQPGQNTEPEALRSRLSRTRQVFKLPTGLQEPAAWRQDERKEKR